MRVLVLVSYEGLAGRALGRRTPDAPEVLERLTGDCTGHSVHCEVLTELAKIQRDINNLTDALTTPLFALFDFYQLPESERERLIGKNLADWGFEGYAEPEAHVWSVEHPNE